MHLDGWRVEVCKGQALVIAHGGRETGYDEAFRSGLLRAQNALDLGSIRGRGDLVIKNANDDHLVWWPLPSGLVIRMVSFGLMDWDVPPMAITVQDASGDVIPPSPAPPLRWHESFRYFRLSQTSDDLFDAYRNAYLSLESILSSIATPKLKPNGKPDEGEGEWFKRALVAAHKIVPLTPLVPVGTSSPIDYMFQDLYIQMRNAMSHAS